ncbi:DUF2799 domain-containing protein [Microbulbifer sp. 2205BS26-8]|uniref:DUF2799 domain-containing protein n=1 Tax=Microbulbifer sp. 2205BS26-8 TaxID=3064386 RepID=UPI00273D9F20|nr:DUF2799 domain-containing protein [Microbulbifer sp. 2205BS26-8]MDP5211228.1 DUF2799 domain-containing protein [Microbulbifer sp. 2205BS26-8]
MPYGRLADWQALGYEDEAAGRGLDYMQKRRQTCAKYHVQINTHTYRSGRNEGLQLYCTKIHGFAEGRAGEIYNGVCPANLEGHFLQGYNTGRAIFMTLSAVQSLEATIHDLELERESLLENLTEKGALPIADEATREERIHLLAEIARLKTRHTELGIDIDNLTFELTQRQAEYQAVLSRSPYHP